MAAAPMGLNIGLLIRRKFFIEICRHTWEYEEEEVCGVLVGKRGLAQICRPMRNASENKAHEYQFDPIEQLDVWTGAAEVGLDIVAIYHSHPFSDAYPSAVDIGNAAAYPNVHYIITNSDSLRSYRILNGSVHEERVTLDG